MTDTSDRRADGAADSTSTSDRTTSTDSSAEGEATVRTRTRTRSRSTGSSGVSDTERPTRARGRSSSDDTDGASGDTSAGADRATDQGDQDDRSDSGDGGDGGGGRRRRRRGGRGRGRRGGQGRGGASGDGSAQDGDDSSDDSSDDRSDDRSGGRTGGRGSQGGGGGRGSGQRQSGRSGGGNDGSSRQDGDHDGDQSDSDDDVEQAIARGGTRVAARRSGRGGSGRRGPQHVGGVSEDVRRAMLDGPPRTMLVTARSDRTQIAVLEDRTVVEHYVTRKDDVTYVGNIYMGRVQNVLPGMEAAFLDIGKGRNGVLYAGEVLYDELDLEEGQDQRIENVLKPGQTVLVQVTKDPMGTKGPRLTMHLSLAGRYTVLAPNSDLFGISRKLTDRERDRLRRIVKQVKPEHHGIIVRTAAETVSEEQLTADIERLLAKWERVEAAAAAAKALDTVYEEPPLVVKVIRDNFGPEFLRCVVDEEDLYHQVRDYLEEVAPELLAKVELYGQPTADARARAAGAPASDDAEAADAAAADAAAANAESDEAAAGDATETDDRRASGDGGASRDGDTSDGDGSDAQGSREAASASDAAEAVVAAAPLTPEELRAATDRRASLAPLFDAYDVTDQLRKAMSRKVWLPSGGYLIVESTEAMKVIDVNTGKFTGDADTNLEEVVLKTNLEAADEIVRQLRLRDMGGIIVIDFIDMLLKVNQDQVVRRLKRELLRDRTKTRVSEVSRLGLVQMTRKNVSQGLVESFSRACETCEGRGLVTELE